MISFLRVTLSVYFNNNIRNQSYYLIGCLLLFFLLLRIKGNSYLIVGCNYAVHCNFVKVRFYACMFQKKQTDLSK